MKRHDPFEIETLRNHLAISNQLTKLKQTYSLKDKNINTGGFWDKRFEKKTTYKDQDAMTREKINVIASYIPNNAVKILDLGIGQAYLEERINMLDKDYDVFGIDLSKTAISRASISYKGTFKVGNVLRIDKYYKKNFFDAIVAVELIEHISPSKIFSFYKKVYKLLKKDGVFIISTPLNEGLILGGSNPSGHIRQYTIPILHAEFKLAGFEIKENKIFYAFRNFYSFKKILSNTFLNHWQPNNIVIKAIKNNRTR